MRAKNNYDHTTIEAKWQRAWEKTRLYKTPEKPRPNKKKMLLRKQYILDMFPYPSGEGLHVGHVEGYTATDIYARFKRMQGYDVLHPIGWDAFGLPAENFAIQSGVHPRKSTDKAIKTFTQQIKAMGLSYDWDREIGTHTPEYYKWTQWIFRFLFEKDLAYRANAPVNWCPSCKTVLANEQVIQGKCERCSTDVSQKNMEQWFIRITKYADRLLKDLDKINWPESTKQGQRNWIGKSEGATVFFPMETAKETIDVFTTRPDTLFGVTYLVLSPEHDFVTGLHLDTKPNVKKYLDAVAKKTQLERTIGKEMTGVDTGICCIHPFTRKRLPIWIADYVLSTYATGAVMGVPAHDERDFLFAKKFKLPIVRVIENNDNIPTVNPGKMINSDQFNGRASTEGSEAITDALTKTKQGKRATFYKLRDWLISRQRYWGAPIPIVYDPDGQPHAVKEHDLPVLLPDNVKFEPTGQSPLLSSEEFQGDVEEIYGKGWRREVDTMDTFMDSNWYFFRFCDPHNTREFASKRAMAQWMPVDLYVGGAEHTVLHLLYARFLTKVFADYGFFNFDEPFMKLRHQGTILGEDNRKMSKRFGNVVDPMDVVRQYGADSLRMFEMFLGPLDVMKPWNSKGIIGIYRFLNRVYRMGIEETFSTKSDRKRTHILTAAVTQDIEKLRFNTAIAKMMETLNAYEKHPPTKGEWETFLLILAPFAPHLTEELWHHLGHTTSIHQEQWPQTKGIKEEEATIVIQVNGKLRGTLLLDKTDAMDEGTVLAIAKKRIEKYLKKNLKKTIFIKGKLINFVVT